MTSRALSFPAALVLVMATSAAACGVGTGSTPTPTCSDDAWCWTRGRPITVIGDRPRGVVVGVGPAGAFLLWDGERWVDVSVPTERTIVSGWSTGAGDAWASDLLGSAWQRASGTWIERPAAAPILRVLAGRDASAWAIAGGEASGHGGVSGARLLRFDGTAWIEAAPAYGFCVGGDFALAPDGAPWTVGLVCGVDGGVNGMEVRRWDGSAWALVGATLERQSWYPAFDVGVDRMRVDADAIYEWDGVAWQTISRPAAPTDLDPSTVAWWDGWGYSLVPVALGCESIYRLDAARAWCTGLGRVAYAGRDGAWRDTREDPYATTASASAWGTMPTTVWAGSDTELAWGASPTDVYRARASTGHVLEHFDGSSWTTIGSTWVRDLEGDASGRVWVITVDGVGYGDATGGIATRPLPAGASEAMQVEVTSEGTALVVTREAVFAWERGAWTPIVPASFGFYVQDVAVDATGRAWIVEAGVGRTSEARVLHGAIGGTFEVADGIAIESWGRLEATTGGVWLATSSEIRRLDATTSLDAPLWAQEAAMWSDGAEIWLTTPTQAVRHGL